MDTEVLSQKLIALKILINRLQQAMRLPHAEKENALKETLQRVSKYFDEGDLPLQWEQNIQESSLLDWLLKTEDLLLDESQQHLALLEAVLTNSPAGLAVVGGPDLIFRLATDTYRQLLPATQVEIIGLPYDEVWSVAQGDPGSRLIHKVLQSDKNLLFDQLELRFPDEQVRSFSLRACRIIWHDEPGVLILVQETTQADRARRLVMDIAEESNRQAEELDAIIMAMAEAMTIFNAQGTAVRANPAAIDLFGFNPVGIDRLDLIDLLGVRSLDGSPIQTDNFFTERALRGETIVGQRILLVDQNRSERVVHVSASPLFDEVQVTAVVTVWHDVTERERLLEQLEIEQTRLETIITNAPEAILVVDEDGSLVLSNPAGERIFGRSLPYGEDYERMARLQIFYDNGMPCAPRNFSLICSALDGEVFNNQEMIIRLPDGKVRNILASTAPIVDRKGNVNGAVGVFQDITQHKQAEATLRDQAGRSRMLAMLSRAFAETGFHFAALLETITSQVGQVFGEVCSLHLLSEDGDMFSIPAVFAGNTSHQECLREIHAQQSFPAYLDLTGQVCSSGQPALLTGQSLEQTKAALVEAYTLLIEKFYSPSLSVLVLPLRAHGRRVGTLNIFRLLANSAFSIEDQSFLQELADRAALAIEDTILYEREAQRAREMQALHQATTVLLSTIDLENLLTKIMESAVEAIPAAQQGILYLLTEPENQLEIRATFNSGDPAQVMPELQEYAARSIQDIQPVIVQSLQAARYANGETPSEGWSAIIAPLYLTERERHATGAANPQRAIGALALFGPQPDLFTENELRLLNSFAATATAALQNARLHAQVQHLAITDSVTDQYNRRKFLELGGLEMHRYRRFQTPLSAIMLDLDNFKQVNDMYGHAAGDQVLRSAAQRCRATIRVVDILGRYGGDEFAILLPGADLHEAMEIAERLRQAITATPIQTEHDAVDVSISLGVAQASPGAETLSSLLGKADAALYQAKQSGRNRVVQD